MKPFKKAINQDNVSVMQVKVSKLFSEHGLKVTQSVPVDHFKFLSL